MNTMDNICCCCGSPGSTLMPSGKWLCIHCSPFSQTGNVPNYDEYLKNKAVQLNRLYEAILFTVNEMQSRNEEEGFCKFCGKMIGESHAPNCLFLRLLGLTDIGKTEYHPYLFFRELASEDTNIDMRYLQDRQVYGEASVYSLERYIQKEPERKELQEPIFTFNSLF